MSNFPPGVSGNEYPIAGPDREWDARVWCHVCEDYTVHTFQSYQHSVWRICDECETQTDEDSD